MALIAVHNKRLEAPEILLQNLITTIEILFDVTIARQSIFFLNGGIHHIHFRVKEILRHGAKVSHHVVRKHRCFTSPLFKKLFLPHRHHLELKFDIFSVLVY